MNTLSPQPGTGAFHFAADAGGTRTGNIYIVPAAGVAGAGNLMQQFSAALSVATTVSQFAALVTGESLQFSVDTGDPAQFAWVNLLELPSTV
jgi:hypothetical protein